MQLQRHSNMLDKVAEIYTTFYKWLSYWHIQYPIFHKILEKAIH